MKKDFASLRDHVVLCGYGQVGREAARNLDRSGTSFIIIEEDPARAQEADAAGYTVVVGDATAEHTLRRVGLERARGVIATLNSDEANVYLTLVSREVNSNVRIVTRAERAERRSTMERAGADRVIVPGETAGVQLTQLILKPNVSAFIEAAIGDGDYDLAEMQVRNLPDIVGQTVGQLDERFGSKVVVIAVIGADGHPEFRSPIDRVLIESDAIIVLTQAGALSEIASA